VASQYINNNNKKQVFSHILRHCGCKDKAEVNRDGAVVDDDRSDVDDTMRNDDRSDGIGDTDDCRVKLTTSLSDIVVEMIGELSRFHHNDSNLLPYLMNHVHHNDGHLVNKWLSSDAFLDRSIDLPPSPTQVHTDTDEGSEGDNDDGDNSSSNDTNAKNRREVMIVLRKAITSKYGWMKGRKIWKRLIGVSAATNP